MLRCHKLLLCCVPRRCHPTIENRARGKHLLTLQRTNCRRDIAGFQRSPRRRHARGVIEMHRPQLRRKFTQSRRTINTPSVQSLSSLG